MNFHTVKVWLSKLISNLVLMLFIILVPAVASGAVPFWAAVIVGREIAVSALREWMAEIGQRAKVRVAMIGKVKTCTQIAAILVILLEPTWQLILATGNVLSYIFMAAMALITIISGVDYLKSYWKYIRP